MTSEKVVDLGSGIAINCNDAAKVILEEVQAGHYTKSKIVNVKMRDGEKEGVNLVADTSYWDAIGMKTEFSFRDSVKSVVEYVSGLSLINRANALAFYGKVPAHGLMVTEKGSRR